MCAQADIFRSGGTRKLSLPESGTDPTDADAMLAAFRARRRELSGARRLFLAVFMTALEDLRRYPRGAVPHTAALRWLMSDDDRWPLAFRTLCTTLDLDAETVRARVLAAVWARGAA